MVRVSRPDIEIGVAVPAGRHSVRDGIGKRGVVHREGIRDVRRGAETIAHPGHATGVVCREHHLDRLTRDDQHIAGRNDDRARDRGRRYLNIGDPLAGHGDTERSDPHIAGDVARGAVDRRVKEIAFVVTAHEAQSNGRRSRGARESDGSRIEDGITRPDTFERLLDRTAQGRA